MDRGLFQRQVAALLGVHPLTITNWERNATTPEIQYIPAIINFLGYNPLPRAEALPGQLATVRMTLGLSQQKLAELLGLDESTVQGWEAGKHQPTQKSLGAIERVLQIR